VAFPSLTGTRDNVAAVYRVFPGIYMVDLILKSYEP